jgi:hypothetical protein
MHQLLSHTSNRLAGHQSLARAASRRCPTDDCPTAGTTYIESPRLFSIQLHKRFILSCPDLHSSLYLHHRFPIVANRLGISPVPAPGTPIAVHICCLERLTSSHNMDLITRLLLSFLIRLCCFSLTRHMLRILLDSISRVGCLRQTNHRNSGYNRYLQVFAGEMLRWRDCRD